MECDCWVYRTQQEEDLRENHPLFDTPLFAVGRDSRLRKLCCTVVQARHRVPLDRDPITGNLLRVPYRRLQCVRCRAQTQTHPSLHAHSCSFPSLLGLGCEGLVLVLSTLCISIV